MSACRRTRRARPWRTPAWTGPARWPSGPRGPGPVPSPGSGPCWTTRNPAATRKNREQNPQARPRPPHPHLRAPLLHRPRRRRARAAPTARESPRRSWLAAAPWPRCPWIQTPGRPRCPSSSRGSSPAGSCTSTNDRPPHARARPLSVRSWMMMRRMRRMVQERQRRCERRKRRRRRGVHARPTAVDRATPRQGPVH